MENTPQNQPEVQSAPLKPHVLSSLRNYDQNYAYAANLMIVHNKDSYDVKVALMNRGMPEDEAHTMAESVEAEVVNARKAKAGKDMLWGAVWCIGGTIITAVTYSAATNGGGTYFVCWGAIIFGLVQFLKGLAVRMDW